MTKKMIEHYFKKFKEDFIVELVIKGNDVYAINKATGTKQIFVNSKESIRISDRKSLEQVKKYIYDL